MSELFLAACGLVAIAAMAATACAIEYIARAIHVARRAREVRRRVARSILIVRLRRAARRARAAHFGKGGMAA